MKDDDKDKDIQDEDHDYLHAKTNSDYTSQIHDEEILFSDKIIKENHYGFNQTRILIITDVAIYNFKGKTLKRRIDHHLVKGVSVSKITDQFIIHGEVGEYDYIYSSPRKIQIIDAIEKGHEITCGKEIKLAVFEQKKIYDYVTSKKQKKKDKKLSKMSSNDLVDIQEYLTFKGEVDLKLYKIEEERRNYFHKYNKYNDSMKLDDFQLLNVIGKGHGSIVCTAKYLENEKIYALKIIDKLYLLENKLYDQIVIEKNLLSTLKDDESNYFVGIEHAFQTEDSIIFVMTYYPGGDLYQLLVKSKVKDKKKGLGETNVAFYATQIGLMLQILHKKNMIYRDLKPENILINNDGYLKLTDFGLSRYLTEPNELSTSFCGTPEYMSPEMINGGGYNKSTDWWSFGVLIYELLCGIPPFYGENLETTYDLILFGELKFPSWVNLSPDAKDICRKLLNKNPSSRLGYNVGYDAIIKHPFFKSVNPKNIKEHKTSAPIKLTVTESDDVSNFDEIYINMNIDPTFRHTEEDTEKIKENDHLFEEIVL